MSRRYQSPGHHFLLGLALFSFLTSYCTFSSISSCFSFFTSPSHRPCCYSTSTAFPLSPHSISSGSCSASVLKLCRLLSPVRAGFHSLSRSCGRMSWRPFSAAGRQRQRRVYAPGKAHGGGCACVSSANLAVLQVTNRCIHMRWRFRTWPSGTDLLLVITVNFTVTFADLQIVVVSFRALCYHRAGAGGAQW